MSNSESISSCSDAIATGNEPGNPCSALSRGRNLSIGCQSDFLSLAGAPQDKQLAATAPSQTENAGSPTNLPATGALPPLNSPVSITNTTSPSSGLTNGLVELWPNMSLPGQIVPNVGNNSLSQLPFQLLNSCNNILALQSVAASFDPAVLQPGAAAACVDPQLAQLISGQLKRKGKGGRQPATDPRLDPTIDPKKAKRILANRQSAAKSKLKQKLFVESLKQKQALMAFQRQNFSQELSKLSTLCAGLEAENEMLESSIKALASLNGQRSLDGLNNQGQNLSMSSFAPSAVQQDPAAPCPATNLPSGNPKALTNDSNCMQVDNNACLPLSMQQPQFANQLQWWQLGNNWPLQQHPNFTPSRV